MILLKVYIYGDRTGVWLQRGGWGARVRKGTKEIWGLTMFYTLIVWWLHGCIHTWTLKVVLLITCKFTPIQLIKNVCRLPGKFFIKLGFSPRCLTLEPRLWNNMLSFFCLFVLNKCKTSNKKMTVEFKSLCKRTGVGVGRGENILIRLSQLRLFVGILFWNWTQHPVVSDSEKPVHHFTVTTCCDRRV